MASAFAADDVYEDDEDDMNDDAGVDNDGQEPPVLPPVADVEAPEGFLNVWKELELENHRGPNPPEPAGRPRDLSALSTWIS